MNYIFCKYGSNTENNFFTGTIKYLGVPELFRLRPPKWPCDQSGTPTVGRTWSINSSQVRFINTKCSLFCYQVTNTHCLQTKNDFKHSVNIFLFFITRNHLWTHIYVLTPALGTTDLQHQIYRKWSGAQLYMTDLCYTKIQHHFVAEASLSLNQGVLSLFFNDFVHLNMWFCCFFRNREHCFSKHF